MIVRVTATEFETSDGRVIPHIVPFDSDAVPTVTDFQKEYDRWRAVLEAEGLIPPAEGDEGGG